jgi:hypothetical protein
LADTGTRGELGAAPAEDAQVPAEIAEPGAHDGSRLGWLAAMPQRSARTVRTHWQFSLVLLAAALLRIVVILGYPPIMWFNDSFNYFTDAINQTPDYVRPNGYPFFLTVLLPLHNFYLVAVAQAALGVGMGVLIYALLRRRGLPWWGGTLLALPVLFDVFEMQIEHLITADTLFTFLVTLAIVICCWRDRPSVVALAIVGLIIGYATIVRSVGQPLLVVFAVGMLARRVGWRRLAALVVAGVVPIAAYMIWFHHYSGKYALNEASGSFLYSRVSTFAECSKMHPSANLRALCDPTPPGDRQPSQEYIWAENEKPGTPYAHKTTPLYNLLGTDNTKRFTPQIEGLTQKFAIQAITSQPLDYARVVIKDTLHTFGWNRQPDPNDIYGNGSTFRFTDNAHNYLPWWAQARYTGDAQAVALNKQLQQYYGPAAAQPTFSPWALVHPWAGFMQIYQKYVFLPGTILGLLLLAGAAGIVLRWRNWGGLALLPWLIGALLIVLPPMTAGFSYRYVLAAMPATCLAAGLAFSTRTGEKSVRALAANLGRYFGRSVPVEQE